MIRIVLDTNEAIVERLNCSDLSEFEETFFRDSLKHIAVIKRDMANRIKLCFGKPVAGAERLHEWLTELDNLEGRSEETFEIIEFVRQPLIRAFHEMRRDTL